MAANGLVDMEVKRGFNPLSAGIEVLNLIFFRSDLNELSKPAFFLNLLYSQWIRRMPYPDQSFEGKTVIVTGSNVGLGLEAARHYVRLGAEKVILAVRSIEKGETAKEDIERTEKRKGVIEVWHLDLLSHQNVKEFAARATKLKRLDVLLSNAAVATFKFQLAEGNESTVTTNVISNFLLGLLLLPKLKETARLYNTRPHLTIVSSEVHFLTNLEEERKCPSIFEALNDPKKARMADRYHVTKLLQVFTTRQLVAERCPDGEKYPVVINYQNPGLCHSALMREVGILQYVLKFIMGARSAEAGSRTLVDATCQGPESHGKYVSDCEVHEPSPFVRSEEGKKTQLRVWKELSEKLEAIQPGILNNI